MAQTYDAGERVPEDLFCVDGERKAPLTFDVSVRVLNRSDVRHVYPAQSVHGVEDVVSTVESSPHATIFEGPNTVLYFDPPERTGSVDAIEVTEE
jgi:hypothetical protein